MTAIKCSPQDALTHRVRARVAFAFEERLDPARLWAALEETLVDFPPFAGQLRVEDNQLWIDCNGLGARTSTVTSQQSFDELVRGALDPNPISLCDAITLRSAHKQVGPVFTVRIHQPRDHGTILGVCWHHSVGDMASFMCLMRAWGARLAGRPNAPPQCPVDREAHFRANVPDPGTGPTLYHRVGPVDIARLLTFRALQAPRQEMFLFYFSDAELEVLCQSLRAASGARLSRNDAVCAHMVAALARHDPKPRPRKLAIAINWRPRLGLDPEVLGNLISTLVVPCEVAPQTPELALRIRQAVDSCVETHLDYFTTARTFDAVGGVRGAWRMLPREFSPMQGSISVTNWSGFGLYDLALDGQRPTFFMYNCKPRFPWASAVYEGPGKQGLLFGASLPRAVRRSLASPTSIAELHQFRPRNDGVPDDVLRVPGLL